MVRPTQNLPPGSQQWARSIESDVDSLTREAQRKDLTQDNTLKGLANSLANLGELVQGLSTQQAQLAATIASLTEQQTYLSSLKSRNSSIGPWSTTAPVADGLWHWEGGTTGFSLDVPTGKVRIFVRASNALASTNVSVPGLLRVGLTYSISGGVVNAGDNISYVSGEIGQNTSAPIVHIGTIQMAPGTYTFNGYRGYQCFTNGGSKYAGVSNTALIVEVVNND